MDTLPPALPLAPVTALDLVRAAADTYTATGLPFAHDPLSAARVFLTTREDGLDIFAFEGTHNPQGWLADFFALHVWDHPTRRHRSLGYIHEGFADLANMFIAAVLHRVVERRPFALAGHSLGAALALLVGGLLIERGFRPVKIGAFAPPRVGGSKFVRVVHRVPVVAFRFGDDPVTDVPFWIPYFFPYSQVRLTVVGKPLPDRFACHHIANYVDGVTEWANNNPYRTRKAELR